MVSSGYLAVACAVFAALSVWGAEERMGCAELLGTNVVSLGTYPSTEARSVRISVRNRGNGVLRIERVVPTCSCLRVDACPGALDPGAVGEIGVTVIENSESGLFRRTFYIETSDPNLRRLQMEVTGNAVLPKRVPTPEKRGAAEADKK